jgi:hypothetical protein
MSSKNSFSVEAAVWHGGLLLGKVGETGVSKGTITKGEASVSFEDKNPFIDTDIIIRNIPRAAR